MCSDGVGGCYIFIDGVIIGNGYPMIIVRIWVC